MTTMPVRSFLSGPEGERATVPVNEVPLNVPDLCRRVDAVLEEFLECKPRTAADGHMPAQVVDVLRGFLASGGKRLRPVLCICGWDAARGGTCPRPVLQAAAALEMFHAFALIHDDLMDQSGTRRGHPTVHRSLATRHAGRGHRIAEQLGASGAILVGDLALARSDELLHTAGLPPDRLAALWPVIDAMRTEIMVGRYLDVISTGTLEADLDSPLRISRYKTAKYTVERPLHIGAVLAGAGPAVLDACTAFALPLGEAFQLRDDLLGVFGVPGQTGKPCLDDLRDGKHTVLIALALQRADAHQRSALRDLVGAPDPEECGAARIRAVLEDIGARTAIEHMIATPYEQALTALDRAPFPAPTTTALRRIAHYATTRTV
ncbi:polyprenyl synthetase family protein [Embleya sp. NPDC001921]